MTLLNAATTAHILHLQTRSYAHHMALNDLYDGLPELVDAVIEQFQGKYGIVTGYPADAPKLPKDALGFVTELSSYVAVNRDFCEDSEIQNEIDAIASLIDSTMYKLKFLA